jgi:hypothetical protein
MFDLKKPRHISTLPDSEVPTGGPAGPLTEVDPPCQRSEWHGSFDPLQTAA